jgi:hypothetical protein
MIEATQNKSGWYSFSVPKHKNKDRYSASLFALAAAKSFVGAGNRPRLALPTGFWGSSR